MNRFFQSEIAFNCNSFFFSKWPYGSLLKNLGQKKTPMSQFKKSRVLEERLEKKSISDTKKSLGNIKKNDDTI